MAGASGLQFEIGSDFSEYSFDNLSCHEAGFDALMTGYSFLKGVHVLSTTADTKTTIQNY